MPLSVYQARQEVVYPNLPAFLVLTPWNGKIGQARTFITEPRMVESRIK